MSKLLEHLGAQFPPDYWAQWHQEFGHDFFTLHGPRTAWYDAVLGDTLAGARVLEIGGFPGLLAAWLLHRGCTVETIEHPEWLPDWYVTWRTGRYACTVHDVTTGAPAEKFPVGHGWDWAIMSDVLLHLDGFPFDFLAWVIARVDHFALCQYPGKQPAAQPCVGGSLKRVYATPARGALIERMGAMGAELVESWEGHDRELFHFRGCRHANT